MITEVFAQCAMCNRGFSLEVDAERYLRWKRGEGHIQDMLPELSADDRELLISQTCGECFDNLFADEDEDEEAS